VVAASRPFVDGLLSVLGFPGGARNYKPTAGIRGVEGSFRVIANRERHVRKTTPARLSGRVITASGLSSLARAASPLAVEKTMFAARRTREST
jgi:hypothetical protein